MEFDPTANHAIRNRLRRLTHNKLIAFSASCCEQLLPDYESFVQHNRRGDVTPLRCALDRIWVHLGGAPLALHEAESLLDGCDAVAPERAGVDDSEEPGNRLARNAVDAVCDTLGSCVERGRNAAQTSARRAIDSALSHLRSRASEGLQRADSDPHRDPLVLGELRRQLDVVTVLEMVDDPSPSFLAGLRASARIRGGEATPTRLQGEEGTATLR